MSVRLPERPALDPNCPVVLSNLIYLNIPFPRRISAELTSLELNHEVYLPSTATFRAAEQALAVALAGRPGTVIVRTLRGRKFTER